MNDARFSDPDDKKSASQLGSTVGLEGSARHGYRIVHEMDDTWTAQERTATAIPSLNQGEEWRNIAGVFTTADEALAAIDGVISAKGLQPAEE